MISSRSNPTIKTIRRSRQCKGAEAVLEGPHLIGEALGAGLELGIVAATTAFVERPEGRRLIERLDRPPLLVAEALLDELTDSDSPRGILAVARPPRLSCRQLPVPAEGVVVLVAGVQDPGNLGAIARAAEAAGAAALALTAGTVNPNHPRSLRASAGSLLRLPTAVEVEVDELLRHLRPARPRLLALVAHGGVDLYEVELDGCIVLTIGAEGPGLDPSLAAAADQRVTIPLAAGVESLNVAVAAGVALFEIARRR